ncbi:MAG: hypothetical protein RLZZ324_1252 [Candidatus Parcubacteria bacterium]|jgi:hypothetical protein
MNIVIILMTTPNIPVPRPPESLSLQFAKYVLFAVAFIASFAVLSSPVIIFLYFVSLASRGAGEFLLMLSPFMLVYFGWGGEMTTKMFPTLFPPKSWWGRPAAFLILLTAFIAISWSLARHFAPWAF